MLEKLQRFITTVDEGSVTRAAKKLHLTQPALSTSLKKLEKELTTQLFTIKQRRLMITESGKNMYRVGKKIIELWNTAKKNSKKKSTEEHLTIGLFDNAALRLAGFLQQQHYNVTLDRSANLVKDITYGLIDIAVIVRDPEEIHNELTIVGETTEALIPVGSTMYNNNVKQLPFILYNQGSQTRKYIDTVFLSQGIKPIVAAQSSSTTFMKELAMQGGGVALLPKNFIKHELQMKKLVVKKLSVKFSRTVAVVTQKDADERIKEHAKLLADKLTKSID